VHDITPAQKMSLDQLGESYYREHGAAIDFVKAQVGSGDEYANTAARAVVSANGAWCECVDLPMEFSGVTGGPVPVRLVSDDETRSTLDLLYGLTRTASPGNTRVLDLFVLYEPGGVVDERSVFAFRLSHGPDTMPSGPRIAGHFQAGRLPLFYRCRIDVAFDVPHPPGQRGLVFFLANVGERHLIVEVPYAGENLVDLSETGRSPMPT
jgi:hypothetical protein